ncbi:MAG: type VI secretion system ImpA family N-terminal domain-containing protein [Limnobacter sp.]|nr:type VI secretion system ImpA family N-terminal domain-containing protein [Limnobacter sp.]
MANHSLTPVKPLHIDSSLSIPLAWFDGYEQCLEWVEPLPDGTCGPNLEYSNEFLELQSESLGRAENQFQVAQEPDWKQVQRLSESLLLRSRDLRLLVLWLTAQLHLKGLGGLLPALGLMTHWCNQHWGSLNPPLDGDDPFERLNAIEVLAQGESFLSVLKRTEVVSLPMIGAVQVRHFAYALDKASPLNPSDLMQRSQLEHAFQMQLAKTIPIRATVQNIQAGFKALAGALSAQLSAQLSDQVLPDFHCAIELLNNVLALFPRDHTVGQAQNGAPTDGLGAQSTDDVGTLPQEAGFAGYSSGVVRSRQDALRAIEAVCLYLEKAEPTNPAQLLLKRAARLIDKNFLALMKDLAPGALNDVARIMGVDPKEILGSDY